MRLYLYGLILVGVLVAAQVPELDDAVDGACSDESGVRRERAGTKGRGFFFIIGVEVFLHEFVFWFICGDQENFAVLSAAGDDLI